MLDLPDRLFVSFCLYYFWAFHHITRFPIRTVSTTYLSNVSEFSYLIYWYLCMSRQKRNRYTKAWGKMKSNWPPSRCKAENARHPRPSQPSVLTATLAAPVIRAVVQEHGSRQPAEPFLPFHMGTELFPWTQVSRLVGQVLLPAQSSCQFSASEVLRNLLFFSSSPVTVFYMDTAFSLFWTFILLIIAFCP